MNRVAVALIAALALAVSAAPPSLADSVKRKGDRQMKTVRRTSTRARQPEPSYEEEEPEPSALEEAWEEYYREQAESLRQDRAERQPQRNKSGTCIIGAKGKVIYAPPGADCGGSKASSASSNRGPKPASPKR